MCVGMYCVRASSELAPHFNVVFYSPIGPMIMWSATSFEPADSLMCKSLPCP